MEQATNEIKRHIDTEREQLGRNLGESEDRIKSATDLRRHFDKNFSWILGTAVAGGFLLSMVRGKSAATVISSSAQAPDSQTAKIAMQPVTSSRYLRRVSETVENIADGLAGVFSHKLHSFVADIVPGFREEYEVIERERSSSKR